MFRTFVLSLALLTEAAAGQARPFHVERTGKGPAIIMIPGLMSSGRVWDATAAHFARTHDVHVITLAGFASQPPIPGDSLLKRERDALIAYIREQKLERPVIMGHSLGGFLALWIGATASELVSKVIAVDGVPFIAALADTSMTEERARVQANAIKGFYATLSPGQIEHQTRAGVGTMTRDTAGANRIVEWARTSDGATVGQAIAEMMTTDLRDDVGAIKVPVLMIGAGNGADANMLERIEKTYRGQIAQIPNHRLAFFPASRHFVMFDEPQRFISEVESFLGAR